MDLKGTLSKAGACSDLQFPDPPGVIPPIRRKCLISPSSWNRDGRSSWWGVKKVFCINMPAMCQWQLGFHKWLQSCVHVAIQFHKSPNQSNFPRNSIYHIDDKIHFIFMVDLADLAETKSLVVSRLVLVMVKSPSVSFESTKSLGIEIMVVETHLQLLVRRLRIGCRRPLKRLTLAYA